MLNRPRVAALVAAALALLCVQPARAQSDILLRLRSGSPLGDRFRIDSAGGMVILGQIGIGIIPASGPGWRLMWHPFKTAFRAGYADGTQFDDANIGFYSWAGGALSTAKGNYSFAMGNQNLAEAQCAVSMGSGNNVYGNATDGFATCGFAMGINNRVHDQVGVGIGQGNNSDGDAAVAIGYNTTADADYSMAFGYRASTNGHTGSKVFGDASTTDSIESTANNEFAARAAGGFRFRTSATLSTGCNLPAGSGVFSCASSRTLKENFTEVDGEELLARVRNIPVNTWNYLAEGRQVRHLGPFAEDFRAGFGLGVDERSIGLLDIDGVNFAGVRALEARTTVQRAEIDALNQQVATLRAANAALEARLQRLEARAAGTP